MSEIKIIHESEVKETKDYSKGYLAFPFDQNQFKDFITGLLGKPQIITKKIVGSFEIHLKDLQNFFDLVHQRVTQQNNGTLIQFITTIYFTDNSSVQLGSYDELVTYNEVKPIISDAVKLSWDYLIKFSDKDVPEKQSIELHIATNTRNEFEAMGISGFTTYTSSNGGFRINIAHTARSWGFDIESVLTSQIKSIIKPVNKIKRFVEENSSTISLIFAVLFFLIAIIGVFVLSQHFIFNELEKVRRFTSIKTNSIDQKLNFLTAYIAEGAAPQYYFKVGIFLLISIIISIVLGVVIEKAASKNYQPSFIVLTRKTKEYRDGINGYLKRKWLWFIGSLIISILTGVVSNYIFKFLVE